MRHEFSRQTKRDALARAGAGKPGEALCEAVGEVYGLEPGRRCNVPLARGVEFDHYPLPAGDRDSDGLDNCVACCPTCHRWKTSHYDVPVLAKGKRVSDGYLGIKRQAGRPIPGSKASGIRKKMDGTVERRHGR